MRRAESEQMIAKACVSACEAALEKARKDQEAADQQAHRALKFCRSVEGSPHVFTVVTMNTYQEPPCPRDPFAPWPFSHIPGPTKIKSSLVCKNCGAQVEMTSA